MLIHHAFWLCHILCIFRPWFINPCTFIESKPAEKQLSKKEQKAKEDAEFAALMGDLGVADAKKEEKKEEVVKAGEGNAKNKKKKAKAAAAKAAAAPKEEAKTEEVKELTKEQ